MPSTGPASFVTLAAAVTLSSVWSGFGPLLSSLLPAEVREATPKTFSASTTQAWSETAVFRSSLDESKTAPGADVSFECERRDASEEVLPSLSSESKKAGRESEHTLKREVPDFASDSGKKMSSIAISDSKPGLEMPGSRDADSELPLPSSQRSAPAFETNLSHLLPQEWSIGYIGAMVLAGVFDFAFLCWVTKSWRSGWMKRMPSWGAARWVPVVEKEEPLQAEDVMSNQVEQHDCHLQLVASADCSEASASTSLSSEVQDSKLSSELILTMKQVCDELDPVPEDGTVSECVVPAHAVQKQMIEQCPLLAPLPHKRVKLRGVTEEYLLKLGLLSIQKLQMPIPPLPAKISQKSFFQRLLSSEVPLRSAMANDVAAAQWDLRHLTLEPLLELRVQNLEFSTESRSHEAHGNFLAALDRQLYEKVACFLLKESSDVLPNKEVMQKLGRRATLILGAAECLPRPGKRKTVQSQLEVEPAEQEMGDESWKRDVDEEAQLMRELEGLLSEIREERELQASHSEASWRRFCRNCCWLLDVADKDWPGHSLVLLRGQGDNTPPTAVALSGDSAAEIAAAAEGKPVAVIWDQSPSSKSFRQVHWEVKYLDPCLGDVLTEFALSRKAGRNAGPRGKLAKELASVLESRAAMAASSISSNCATDAGNDYAKQDKAMAQMDLVSKGMPTPSRAPARQI